MKSLDIETIPNEEMIQCLPEVEVAANLKDPAKIEEKRKEAKQKQINKMALNPFYGRACSYSWCCGKGKGHVTIAAISDADEISLINSLLSLLTIAEVHTNKIITWNGMNFDFPFIFTRAAILKITMPDDVPGLRYWTKKYSQEPHCDLMQELAGWNIERRTNLDEAGRVFLGRGKTERDYKAYADLIKSGQGEIIGADNECDAVLTWDLYEYLENYLF